MSVIRRFFAAAVLLALVVGAPIALWFYGRHFLPDHIPSWTEVKAFFIERDTGQLFLGALTIIAIIAWLVFTLSVLVEAAAMLAGRQGQWRIPGFRLPQRAAMALLATLFTATITVGTALPAFAAAPAPLAAALQPYHLGTPAPAPPARSVASPAAVPQAARAATGGPTVTVGRYDTLWRLAENHLGDGFRSPEIVALNVGVAQPDGGMVESADTALRPGWVLRLPADADLSGRAGTHPVAVPAPTAPTSASDGDIKVRAQPGDTVSKIAEEVAGDGDLWPSVAAATGLKDPNQLDVGQEVIVPIALLHQTDPAATRTTRVEEGDTLSGIAAREYGTTSVTGWLAQVNGIADPNVIDAGSYLRLPAYPGPAAAGTSIAAADQKAAADKAAQQKAAAADKAAATAAAEKKETAMKAAAAQKASTEKAAADAAAHAKVAAIKDADSSPGTAPPPVSIPSIPTAPAVSAPDVAVTPPAAEPATPTGGDTATATTTTTVRQSDVTTRAESSTLAPALAVGGGGVVLTGLAFAALIAARRRQFRWRRPGRAIQSTPAELVAVERTVFAKGSEHVADVTWLDDALRTLAQELARTPGSRIPDAVAAKLTDDHLQLVLALPADTAPAPWRVDDFGLRWTLDRSAQLPPLERDRSFGPLPALVSVGYTQAGEHWLIDLEMVGSISLTGDRERCLSLMRYMAAELAHNAWSDGLRASLVGVGAELAVANPGRLVCGQDLTAVLRELSIQLDAVAEVSAAASTDVAAGRLHNVAGDTWATEVVLIGPDATGDRAALETTLGRLQSASQGRQAAAVVVTVDEDTPRETARWVLEVDSQGMLKIPALQVQLIAEQLPANEAADLAALLALASTTDDVPAPASSGDAEWDTFADEAGALRAEMTAAGEPSALHVAGTAPDRRGSILPLPVQVYVAAAAVTAEDVELLAPGVSDEVRERVEWSSRTLDDDLAAWWDEKNPTPKVTVLGPIKVQAPGVLDTERPRWGWHTEVVVYLAMMTGGVTAERMGLDLFPDEVDAHETTKLRKAVTATRRWLGPNPRTGRDHLPSNAGVAGGRYRLEDVLVDAELFRRLRVRALARGADGIADLQAALQLVSGVPFTDRRGRAYGWLGNMDHTFTGMIADTSHIVATHLLANRQPEEALAAAQAAMLAGTYGDDVLLDCAATCYARGLTAEGRSYIRQIMSTHDAEVEEDLPKHTYEVLLQRGWLAS